VVLLVLSDVRRKSGGKLSVDWSLKKLPRRCGIPHEKRKNRGQDQKCHTFNRHKRGQEEFNSKDRVVGRVKGVLQPVAVRFLYRNLGSVRRREWRNSKSGWPGGAGVEGGFLQAASVDQKVPE